MIIKKENDLNNNIEIVFEEKDKTFAIASSENLDIYLYFISKESNKFEIKKENNYIYECFSELYDRVKNNELFKVDEEDLKGLSKEEIEYLYEESKNMNDYQKIKSNYDEMFKDDKIVIVTDNKKRKRRNSYEQVSITKEKDKIVLDFNYRVNAITINHDNSYYKPYNLLFMDLFNDLMKYDTNDNQIHIEEYLYNSKKRVKK